MKLNSFSIILSLIVLIIPASYSYQACSSYKPNFEADCSSLSDKTKTCRYYNKQCICNKIQCSDLDTKYKCENYYIDQSFNEICVYDNERGCFMQNKLCSDWSDLYGRDYCEKFRASRPSFHVCRYNNGQCFENLGICSDTLMPYSDETDTRLRCETIIPNENNYKCILDYYGGPGQYCRLVEVCSTATTQEQCESMILPERSRRYKCVFENGTCKTIKQYEDYCPRLKTKDACEANIPQSDLEKCVYDNTLGCIAERKPCSDWKKYFHHERDYGMCSQLFGSKKPGYECRYINGECVEHLGDCRNSFKYTDMSTGSCESIIPSSYEYEKCVYMLVNDLKECKPKTKLCTEDINKYGLNKCQHRITQNSEKICISNGEKCIESYGKCEDYKTNVNKATCESIKPYNDLGKNVCIYQNNLCVSKSWYELEQQKFKAQCESIKYRENEYCSFVNDECIQPEKNCLDIKSINEDLTEEICKEGKLSDPEKVCVLKDDKKGCEEKKISIKTTTINKSNEIGENVGDNDDESDENKGDNDNKDEENEQNDENGENENIEDSGKLYKNKFYIFMTFILLL